MDSVKLSSVTPRKSRLARTFAKVLHVRAAAGVVSPDDDVQKPKLNEKMKKDRTFKVEGEGVMKEAFMAKMFASLSSIKASYAQLQYAQSPYDADGIQSADQMIVSELRKLSELKQCYLKKELHDPSPETALLRSEVQEQSSLVKMYEITSKKTDSQLRLKESEIMFLKEKLLETSSDCRLLERRLNSSGPLGFTDAPTKLSCLRPTHFIAFQRQAVKSIRSFVRLLVDEMDSQEWDLVGAASSIHPGVSFWKSNHVCFAFESFVCGEMFDGFDHRPKEESSSSSEKKEDRRRVFFDRFVELKSVRPADYLAWKPKSSFAAFCRAKYLRVVHPKMEESFFGNLEQRSLVSSGELPETPFFTAFVEMARLVWLLRCLAFSFEPSVSIFRVSEGSRFSEVYMESLSDEAFDAAATETEPHVAFTVVPGFRIDKIVVQSQVYLN